MRMFMKTLTANPGSRMELGAEANFDDKGFYQRYLQYCEEPEDIVPSTAWRKLGAKANPNDGSLYSLYTTYCQANNILPSKQLSSS
ncbi:hypothetical protein COCOBI_pt-1480 (chloroplast) [Coccomyxa sp. Obi]|nr:hypothetical protein COCOBI_pt-1480 [Coccomyxa sp. Obi]